MDETLQKWNTEFNIHDSEKEPTTFLLLKDYLDSFNIHKVNHIADEQNRIIIDERVAEKSSHLQEEIDSKSQELSELSEEFKHVTTTCNNLYAELDSLKQNKNLEIEKAVEQSVSANAEFIHHLKSEIDSLKLERNQILSDFVKDNICSSQINLITYSWEKGRNTAGTVFRGPHVSFFDRGNSLIDNQQSFKNNYLNTLEKYLLNFLIHWQKYN